jgi:shikimate dehydrogenase
MTKIYALIGYPLSHSFSPSYFNEQFKVTGTDAVYRAVPMPDLEGFPAWLAGEERLAGINVTIPYKEAIIPYLDEVDATAAAIGAVNCIAVQGGKTKGYNTDVVGFADSLTPLLGTEPVSALVLGTGGAAKAITWVLRQLAIPYTVVSRGGQGADAFAMGATRVSPVTTYAAITPNVLAQHRLIINTTPVGTYPNVNDCPQLPYSALTEHHILYDLIYNPSETAFLRQGRLAGAATKNGLEMLHLQAQASWAIWNRP